jgi:aarF domain-containing kinase
LKNNKKNYKKNHKLKQVPKVYWNYSSDRILTMEYCSGYRVDDFKKMKENNVNVNKVSERLGIIFSEMIFKNGFVHCDPHPGNVLINPINSEKKSKKQDFQIVLLDHGLYQVKRILFFNLIFMLL